MIHYFTKKRTGNRKRLTRPMVFVTALSLLGTNSLAEQSRFSQARLHTLKLAKTSPIRPANLTKNARSPIFKKVPFEPRVKKSRHKKSDVKYNKTTFHQGKGWLETEIQDGDTLHGIIKRHGLSIKDLYIITHMEETYALKNLHPGQKVKIHADGAKILELIQDQKSNRKLHVKKTNSGYEAYTTVNGEKIQLAKRNKFISKKRYFASHFPALDNSFDEHLQQRLHQTIKQLGLLPEIDRKKLAVALVDITDINHPRFAALNTNKMMYASSLPKIAILLGAFVEIERGSLALDKEVRHSLTQMVRISSNEEATNMLNRVGKKRLQEILISDRFQLYDPHGSGGLWVGKEYGKRPAFKKDPLHNLSHGATVLQAARFYYLLESERIVSPELTQEMKAMLSRPEIKHKFVKGLEENRPNATVYRKSGSWRQWHADSAIVEENGYKYIVVALAENSNGGQWLADMITPLHDLIVHQNYAQLK